MYWLPILIAIGFGIARLSMPVVSEVHREDLFKDFAHLFVGGMFGAGLRADYQVWREVYHEYGWLEWLHNRSWLYLGTAIALTVLEVFAFYIHKA